MATSRTGTAQWKNTRARLIQDAQERGQSTCPIPGCGTPLDYNVAKKPNSPEVDHITPHAHGGTDHDNNLRVICRQCNQRLGGRAARRRAAPLRQGSTVTNLIDW